MSKTFKMLPKWRKFGKSGHTASERLYLKLLTGRRHRKEVAWEGENFGPF